ncbi:MAG: lysophospholipid acyltransferase family protein [Elusimicrobiota bacterium]
MAKKIYKKIYKSGAVKFIRHLLLANTLVGLLIIIVLLPYKVSLALGRILGTLVCFTYKKYRITADKNLKKALSGEYSPNELRNIRIKTFKNIGMNLMEFAVLNFRSKKFWKKRIEIHGRENIEKYLKQNKGIIYLTAHIGNWELMGAFLAMTGYPINVVARKVYDRRLNWLLVNIRKRRDVNTIYRTGRRNTKKMIKVLKRGEVLGILIDQDTKVGGTFADFFGQPAYTPTAVSQFSRIKDTVILPGFIYRKSNLNHQIIIKEAVPKGTNEQEETQKHNNIIENMIREEPSQWVWMHRRWKKRP